MPMDEIEVDAAPKVAIPKRIFIVPYRNRIEHKYFFSLYMTHILADDSETEIYFSHQSDYDNRTFNRGATRNIGFIAMRDKYPNDYKNITFIFNDVDTIPFAKIFDYETTLGTVKHYYGYKHSLGGIVVIKGFDFEIINGYPCFWGWGGEDNILLLRCNAQRIKIDRSNFHPVGSPQILQLFDGVKRAVDRYNPYRSKHDNGADGLTTMKNIKYTIDDESTTESDNAVAFKSAKIKFINISNFLTLIPYESGQYHVHDIRDSLYQISNPDEMTLKLGGNNNAPINPKQFAISQNTNSNWTNIPYRATQQERELLVKKYGQAEAAKIIQQRIYNSTAPLQLPPLTQQPPTYARPVAHYQPQPQPQPRQIAQASANIRMGGVMPQPQTYRQPRYYV